MPDPIEVNYVPDGDDWQVTVVGRGQLLTGKAPGLIAARDRADQLVEKIAPEEKHRTVVHLLDGDALQFTSAYLTARLAKPAKPATPPPQAGTPAPAAAPPQAGKPSPVPRPAADTPAAADQPARPARSDARSDAEAAVDAAAKAADEKPDTPAVQAPAPRTDSDDAGTRARADHGAGKATT